jgi:CheY-like chemotaxis protein
MVHVLELLKAIVRRVMMATAQVVAPQAVMAQPKILVVDNLEENVIVMESLLAYTKAQIVTALSGPEALEAMRTDDFALVLLDVAMPEMNGFQVARAMRENPRSAKTPVIFVTAYPQEDVGVHEGYDAGAVDFLFKPIDPALLRSKVQVFLDLFRRFEDQVSVSQRLSTLHDDLIVRQLTGEVSRETLARRNRELALRCDELVRRSREKRVMSARIPTLQAVLDYLDLMEACEDRSSADFNQWIRACRNMTRVCME